MESFNFGNLASAAVGAVVKVAVAIASAIAEAAIGALAAVAEAREDGELSNEQAEELFEEKFKALLGAFMLSLGSGSSGVKSDEEEDYLEFPVQVTDGAAVTYDKNGGPSEQKSVWNCVLGVKDYISNGVSQGISNVKEEASEVYNSAVNTAENTYNNFLNDYQQAENAIEESNKNEYNKIAADEEELENLQKQSDEMIQQRIDIEKDNAKNKVEWEHQDMEDYLYGDDDSGAKVKVRGNAADAKAEAKFSVFDDKKIDPQARFGAEAKYSGIKVEGEGELGDRNLGGGIEGKGGLLNADAEAYLKIGKDEASGKWNTCVQGKAMASVAEGSVEGKVKIVGLEIDAEGTGYAGGIGVGFEGGIVDGKLKLGAKAAALLGVGASVSIGLADKEKEKK